MAKKCMIKFTNRDFNSIKSDLLDYSQRYYNSIQKDFNEGSFGSMMLDLVAYVGDNLSYYLDYSVNESFLDNAIEYRNILRHGKSLGFNLSTNPSSYGNVTLYLVVPAKISGIGPDSDYIPVLLKGSGFSTGGGIHFSLNENVDFSKSSNEIVTARVDTTTGIPTFYAIKCYAQVLSGELYRQTISIGNYTPFLRLEMVGNNYAEIISVTDSEGHTYYETDFLSQNVIYKAVPNFGDDHDTVSNILKPLIVPRRFVVEKEEDRIYLQFGAGSEDTIMLNSIAEPASVVLQVHGKDYYTDNSFDPALLASADKMGVSPSNTILTIFSRINSSQNVNAATNTITSVNDAIFEYADINSLDPAVVADINSSLEVTNEEPIVGDVSLPSTEEVRRRIYDNYACQNRAVTKQDYVAVCYRMPSKFGSVKRASIEQDNDSFKRNLNLYVLSENSDGTLATANNTIKTNLKTWLTKYKSINDSIDILDAVIYNFGIEFEFVPDDEKNKYVALNEGMLLLKDLFSVQKDIGENLLITEIYSTLKLVPTILDVTDVRITSKYGGVYNDASFDPDKKLSADGRTLLCPPGSIYELKYPSTDIRGSAK